MDWGPGPLVRRRGLGTAVQAQADQTTNEFETLGDIIVSDPCQARLLRQRRLRTGPQLFRGY